MARIARSIRKAAAIALANLRSDIKHAKPALAFAVSATIVGGYAAHFAALYGGLALLDLAFTGSAHTSLIQMTGVMLGIMAIIGGALVKTPLSIPGKVCAFATGAAAWFFGLSDTPESWNVTAVSAVSVSVLLGAWLLLSALNRRIKVVKPAQAV